MKNNENSFVGIGKWETCEKYLNKIPPFSRTVTFFCEILHCLISIIKLFRKKSVFKTEFYINHASHLKQ